MQTNNTLQIKLKISEIGDFVNTVIKKGKNINLMQSNVIISAKSKISIHTFDLSAPITMLFDCRLDYLQHRDDFLRWTIKGGVKSDYEKRHI